MMFHICIVCAKSKEIEPKEEKIETHGICSSFCEKVHDKWLEEEYGEMSLYQAYLNAKHPY